MGKLESGIFSRFATGVHTVSSCFLIFEGFFEPAFCGASYAVG